MDQLVEKKWSRPLAAILLFYAMPKIYFFNIKWGCRISEYYCLKCQALLKVIFVSETAPFNL